MKVRLLRIPVLIAVLLATLSSASAGAHENRDGDGLPEVPEPGISDPINEAEMQDLETLSSHYGISIDDAIARFAWNDNFALAVDGIRQNFPDEFAGAKIVDASRAWVAFAGAPPSDALLLVEEFTRSSIGLGVTVETRADRQFTERELDQTIQSIHYAIFNSPLAKDVASGYDIETGLVTSHVVLADGVDRSRIRQLQQLADGLSSAAIEVKVSVAETSALGGPESGDWHYGGEAITCTTGFTAKTGGGSRRVVTAGHCGDSQTDDGDSLPFSADYEGTHGDFQSHTGSEPIADNFYSGNATTLEVNLRDVSAIGAPVDGQGICKNGEITKKDCLTVYELNHCIGSVCNLVLVGEHVTENGDSGGPWFYGNTAYGIHMGWKYDPFAPFDRSAFSRADRLDNALGLTVATS